MMKSKSKFMVFIVFLLLIILFSKQDRPSKNKIEKQRTLSSKIEKRLIPNIQNQKTSSLVVTKTAQSINRSSTIDEFIERYPDKKWEIKRNKFSTDKNLWDEISGDVLDYSHMSSYEEMATSFFKDHPELLSHLPDHAEIRSENVNSSDHQTTVDLTIYVEGLPTSGGITVFITPEGLIKRISNSTPKINSLKSGPQISQEEAIGSVRKSYGKTFQVIVEGPLAPKKMLNVYGGHQGGPVYKVFLKKNGTERIYTTEVDTLSGVVSVASAIDPH